MSHAVGVVKEARIAGKFRRTKHLGEAGELRIVADRDDEMTVARPEAPDMGTMVGWALPIRCGAVPGYEVDHRPGWRARSTCVSRSDMSIWHPSPVASRPFEAARIADGRVDSGEDVGIGDTDLLRLAAWLAGQVHDSTHALDHQIVAGTVCVGSVLAEAGD